MNIRFTIDFRTQFGQDIYISGSLPELGEWDLSNAVKLSPDSGELWSIRIKTDVTSLNSLSYKYFVKDSHTGQIFWEFGENRLIHVKSEFKNIELRDFWRPHHDHENPLLSSPFHKAFFKRDKETPVRENFKKEGSYLRLRLRAPRVGKDYRIAVTGSSKSLGEWDDKKALLMDGEDYPIWKIDIPIHEEETPFEYKYVIYSTKEEKIKTWEGGMNRYFPVSEVSKGSLLIRTDEKFVNPVGNYKVAGVAIPVFSIRSKKGAGIGEFPDIKLMVDWAVKTRMKIIQILPVNDTVATHTWVDSYPYAAISVHALHPILGNMNEIGKLKNKKEQTEINKEAKMLNELPTVDFDGVMRLKSRFYKLSYDENKDEVLKSKDYKNFIKRNENWIHSYAAFSYLRDLYKTPDFNQWEEYRTLSDEDLKKLISPKSKQFNDIAVHYYIQFFLDKQLREASEYARENGVVLKGDIPIGIYRYSVDAWRKPHLFNMSGQSGAPPDGFAITGQNWGFPPYNWDEMAKDGYEWWHDRMVKMADYFDIFRIDHILGFFRIWEIDWENLEGITGHFNPSIPVHRNEFQNWGIYFDQERFCRPYIRAHMINEIFGNHAQMVFNDYLNEYAEGCYELKEEYNTQRKIKDRFDAEALNSDFHTWLKNSLFRLLSEVLFFEAPLSSGDAFNPRIAFHSTYSYRELDPGTRENLDRMYIHYFYKKHNEFWGESAMKKLPILKDATDMLICGEDLGMVPDCVPGVMDDLQILSLAIQRMPNDDRQFWHPSDTPYLSVTTTGSHDLSTLREWWEEDFEVTQKFFNQILGHHGGAPFFCEPWIAKDIINQHMYSPSMLAIFPIQDLIAMDGRLRTEDPKLERINVPAIAQHYWKYRFHIPMETLIKENGLNSLIRQMVDQSGRSADF